MDKAKAWDELKVDLERWTEGAQGWETPTEWELPGIALILELMRRREEQA